MTRLWHSDPVVNDDGYVALIDGLVVSGDGESWS